MTSKETEAMADLVESADLIILVCGSKKAAIGKDIQASIVTALRVLAIDTRKLEDEEQHG